MATAKFDRKIATIALQERVLALEADLEMIDPEPAEGDIITIVLNERLNDLDPILEIIEQDWSNNELVETIDDRIAFIEETYPDDKWSQRRIADLNHVALILKGQHNY